jgi:hypothetical protein
MIDPFDYTDDGLLEPLDDLRDDELWAPSEKDGTARVVLEEARKQAQTTLTILETKTLELRLLADLKDISNEDSKRAQIELLRKRRSTVVFLQLVSNRQARLNARDIAVANKAIHQHWFQSQESDFEATPADRTLWKVIGK